MKKYLVIDRDEDEVSLTYYSQPKLIKALNEGTFSHSTFLSENDWDGDFQYFPSNSVIIFCGELVIPKPVEKVVEYTL